jgi:hypothetical protein
LTLIALAVLFALSGCKNQQPSATNETPAQAPRGALELVFPYGSEKEKWITDVTTAFNRSGAKTQSGKTIFVRAIPTGSGESIDNILSGRLSAHLVSPASAAFMIWVLASSRPDLIEVDLKRPGRIDVKIPLFPTTTAREGFDLLRMLCGKRGLDLSDSQFPALESHIPTMLTPGAAEALAVKIYRQVRTGPAALNDVLNSCLADYQSPIAPEVMNFQIQIASSEATDLEFVPPMFRLKPSPSATVRR